MKVAIIGAGVAGLAAARALTASGLEVELFEAAPDLGGVWSATRRYPGIAIQNDKQTYAFSDAPMPDDYPEFPGGALVRAYLEQFSATHGLTDCIRLATRVVHAARTDVGDGWLLEVEDAAGSHTVPADWLVVANGVFSVSHVPQWSGRESFEDAGGMVLSPSDLGDGEILRDRRVVVLGSGKSACDIAVASLGTAASTHLVARTLRWKLPKRVGRLPFQRVLLSRLGEHLLWGPHRTLFGRVLRRLDDPLRILTVRRLGVLLERAHGLSRSGVRPTLPPSHLDALATDGFFDAVAAGRIAVHREQTVRDLVVQEGRPSVELTDGTRLAADVVVSATGYDQDVSLLDASVREQILDADGGLPLYRRILPRTDRLAFIGWALSFRSPLVAEMQALWLTALLHGVVHPPSPARRATGSYLYGLTHAAPRGQMPVNTAILELDGWIADFGGRVPMLTHVHELTGPVDPARYRFLLPDLLRRIRSRGPADTPAAARWADSRVSSASTGAEPRAEAAHR